MEVGGEDGGEVANSLKISCDGVGGRWGDGVGGRWGDGVCRR